MEAARLLKTAIIPALVELQQRGIQDSREARRFLLAIALQESGLAHRRQVTQRGEDGPAASYWQFEQGGGCKGVLTHRSAKGHMYSICDTYDVLPEPQALWEAMRYQDIVAASAARLLIYTLPSKLPMTAADGWNQYVSAWRPGKPHPETWPDHWATAEATVGIV